jgi:hypothetical protein
MVVVATDDWAELARVEVDLSVAGRAPLSLIGRSADGRGCSPSGRPARGRTLHWFDAENLELVHTIAGALPPAAFPSLAADDPRRPLQPSR